MTDILSSISSEALRKKNLSTSIVDRIRGLVNRGELQPGDRLPSEVDLGQALGVSRTTVREALNILEHEGIVVRRQGVGTFITRSHLLRNRLDLHRGVTEIVRSMGHEPGTKRIEVTRISADEQLAERLQIPIGQSLVEVRRIRTSDGKPVVASRAYVQESYFKESSPDFDRDRLVQVLKADQSLLQILESLGRPVSYALARLEPVHADAEIAASLGINKGEVLMRLTQVEYNEHGEPLMFSHEHYVAEASVFTIFRRR